MNNINNNGNSKEWIWNGDKGLEYPEAVLVPGWSEVKDRALNDENKDRPLENKIRKVFHWKEEEHRYVYT
jgi:hypothetical protein